MKLTAFTDYSLRVLIFLATAGERRATIAEIAAAFDVSQNHLTKVVNLLARKGWVETLRGRKGGIVLARAAEAIRIGRVVRDTEGAAVPAECFETGTSHCAIAHCCRLKGVLHEAVEAFHAVLDRYTLADLAAQPQAIVQVLHLQHPPRPPATRT